MSTYMIRIFGLFFLIVGSFSKSVHSQGYNSVVISEIMADPAPVIGLPNAEYLEIYNRSSKAISVKGWKLVTGSRSLLLPDSTLLPDAFAIICHKNNLNFLSVYGMSIGLSSFSLTNKEMILALYNQHNQLVYSISYLNKWWESDKRNGGFSLEMADTNNPCGEMDNWLTSIDKSGGTPGRKNSIEMPNIDLSPPFVERVDILKSDELIVIFNKRMDSLNAVSGAVIEISGRKIARRQLELTTFHNLKLTLDSPLLKGQEYQLSIRNISDCSGNLLRESSHTLALPSQADSGDIVINEVLFNPREAGVDFVELYNRSKKYISLKDWTLSNTKNDVQNTFSTISVSDVIMAPYSCLALTTDPSIVREQYPTDKSRNFLEMNSFPSYPNTEGSVILRDAGLNMFDTFTYSETMHHELLLDVKGVSLEKINVNKSSANMSNWQSAAATIGYATPGYYNSQIKPETSDDVFIVEPEAFTPDNDGRDDEAIIRYKQSFAGQIASLRIYDVSGRLIKNLVRNQLIGTSGDIHWNGTDEQGELVKTGYYLLLIDTFNITGDVQQYKKRIIVARKDR